MEPCVEETDIVTFQVNDKPFKFLSDHYGIETHLTYTKDLKRTGIHDEIPFKLEWTNWGLYIKMIFLLIIIHIEFFWGYRLWIILLTIFIVFNIMYIIEYCIGNQEFSDEIILTPINPWRKKGHRKSLSTSSETFIHKALGPVNPFEETHTLYENFQF